MLNQMTFPLWAAFYLMIWFAVLGAAKRALPSRRALPALAGAFLGLYLCALGFAWLLYDYFGQDPLALYGFLILWAAGAAAYLARLFWRAGPQLNRPAAGLMGGYLVVVLFITLFSRLGESRQAALELIPFENLIQALAGDGVGALGHSFLNLLLFVPAGLLLPRLCPAWLGGADTGFLFGLVLSVAIETIQLAARLGTCDVNDIVSNALGAAVGALFVALSGASRPRRGARH